MLEPLLGYCCDYVKNVNISYEMF